MVGMTAEQYMYGRTQLLDAKRRLRRAKELTNSDKKEQREEDPISLEVTKRTHRRSILIDSQLCIELSSKSLFPLLGIQHPESHGISFEEASDLLDRTLKSTDFQFARKSEIPRAIFLTQLWKNFYTLSKYGYPDHWITADDIFRTEDSTFAINHAEFCVQLADDLSEYQMKQYNEEYGEHPEDVWYVRRYPEKRDLDVDPTVEWS